ncbi:MAG: phenylalanine--tRNA ligase subunit beta [Candidatus Bathyarchaeota archaeon]|nr:phenylalanine--tRNA ligase subunit beta [Candidatus Bathyarchaeota archaeon]
MPTIDVDLNEFERLLGKAYNGDLEEIDELLSLVKSEIKGYNKQDNTLNIEVKDTNRPDLWSVEGLTRALRGFLDLTKGAKTYNLAKALIDVNVDPKLEAIRPFIGCAIIKNVALTDTIIRGLMQLQDKLHKTYGRNRQKTSIGLYDFDLITPPLSYQAVNPDKISFVPLGFTEKLSLNQILDEHPKGQEYAHIINKHSSYPILMDANKNVLSFPPIINSNDIGKVTEQTKNLLVEVTGTQQQIVLNTLNLVVLSVLDENGQAYAANIHYPNKDKQVTPDFAGRQVELNVEYTNKILGMQFTGKQIAQLLQTAGFDIKQVDDRVVMVLVPCYRVDIMHQIDLVEDVAVAYGYNNIEAVWKELATTGSAAPQQHLINTARDLMAGSGYQEVLNYTLTNPDNLFTKMNHPKTATVDLLNPKIVTMTCLRNWLLPSLMEFLSNNQSVEFPHKIFELGKITLPDPTAETKTHDKNSLAAATCHPTAGFSEIKACLDAFFLNLGVTWQIKPAKHPSFIEGRVGTVLVDGKEVGVVGEIHPQVLTAWKLENPVAAFEVDMEQIERLKTA